MLLSSGSQVLVLADQVLGGCSYYIINYYIIIWYLLIYYLYGYYYMVLLPLILQLMLANLVGPDRKAEGL